ncbi:DUF2142 domain-containing protein [Enterococcus sp. HY326]|uniref:DUF2142 domain-containing protein n=1 Tax=Enterococcus sp. HY326 TaxID=2971265 RepID=UPI00224078A6|nr:DUF2142 domain-containing protein [Enterococcus sp. HY326]
MSVGINQRKPAITFFVIMFVFGLLSIFVTFPLSNGDEGFHLSVVYNMFSANHPEAMSEEALREIEMVATSLPKNIDLGQLFSQKITAISADGVALNILTDSNLISRIDIAHLPAALGALIGRFIYPSIGWILVFSRLTNLLFFLISFYFIIKASKVGQWSLIMLFTVPFIQKLASPSYDVFCYVVVSFFIMMIFNLQQKLKFAEYTKREWLGLTTSLILLFFLKNNYLFALPLLLALPSLHQPVLNWFKKLKKHQRSLLVISGVLLIGIFLIVLHWQINLVELAKVFFTNYLNVETMGRRARQLWQVTPLILPNLLNILWLLCLFLVLLTGKKRRWFGASQTISIGVFLLNWLGIFAGFYLLLNKQPFDDLSGRYISPFLILFLPLLQNFGTKYELQLPEKVVKRISLSSTIIILVLYLIICYYRGFVWGVTPTWTNLG